MKREDKEDGKKRIKEEENRTSGDICSSNVHMTHWKKGQQLNLYFCDWIFDMVALEILKYT